MHSSVPDLQSGSPLRSGVAYTATPNGQIGVGMFAVAEPVFRTVTTASTIVGLVATMAERPSYLSRGSVDKAQAVAKRAHNTPANLAICASRFGCPYFNDVYNLAVTLD